MNALQCHIQLSAQLKRAALLHDMKGIAIAIVCMSYRIRVDLHSNNVNMLQNAFVALGVRAGPWGRHISCTLIVWMNMCRCDAQNASTKLSCLRYKPRTWGQAGFNDAEHLFSTFVFPLL